jgi:cytochrome c peroxidase
MRVRFLLAVFLLFALAPVATMGGGVRWTAEPVLPLTALPAQNPRLVMLGDRLFHDPLLSADGTVSCASCHDLASAGMDAQRVSRGVGGAQGAVNAPTVFNSAYNLAQFWDGRAPTLEEQAGGPIVNPVEMASTWPQVVARVRSDPAYAKEFAELFQEGVTPANIRAAIAAFERTLVTSDSAFDRFLKGDGSALTDDERAGYALFKDYGCSACHQGANVGGNMYQVLGTMGDYFGDRGNLRPSDLGRFNVTGREEDRHVFKVPSLRLAARTGPYFHDGSRTTLEEAIRTMAHYQLGRDMPDGDVAAIAAFLRSLAGRHERLAP